MNEIDIFKVIVFAMHFFFFGLTVLFFLLKFHKKDKLKLVMFFVGALWIIFGIIDFFLELNAVLSMFMHS